MATTWVKDAKAESVLSELGLAFDVQVIPLSEINHRETEKNTGRTGRSVSAETVDDYAIAMMGGASFPMPVVSMTRRGAVILAGVHRTKAAVEAGEKEIRAYVIDELNEADSRMVAIMTNRKEGVRVGKQEAIEYAIHLVSELGMDPAQIASRFGINKSLLNDRLRAAERKRTLAEAGFKYDLPVASLNALASVDGNIKVMKAVADLAAEQRMNSDDVRDLSRSVSKQKTEAQQLAAVEKEAEKRRTFTPTANGKVTVSVRTKFIRAFHLLQQLCEGKERLEDVQIVRDSDEHKRISSEWKELRKQLDAICK